MFITHKKMIKKIVIKILNNLSNPQKLPKKIFDKINFYLESFKYDRLFFEKEQNSLFNFLGLDRKEGIKILNDTKNKINPKLNSQSGMSSEHEIVFSCLSLIKKSTIFNVLEIGTFDGYNALLLSNLFPNSNIDTMDLPEGDGDFINFYNRKTNVDDFVKKRNRILNDNKNITFLEENSLNLIKYKKKYDLIWIDGAHGYPVVCIDIINSLHRLNENGMIMCDDIHLNLNKNNSDKMYNSIASFETLKELEMQNLISLKLIYKRLNLKDNCIKKNRKFIAIIQKA